MDRKIVGAFRPFQTPGWAFAFVLLIGVAPAHAYLDPGNGSMLLQLLLGGAAGAAVLARLAWQKLVGAVRPVKASAAPGAQTGGASDPRDPREHGEA